MLKWSGNILFGLWPRNARFQAPARMHRSCQVAQLLAIGVMLWGRKGNGPFERLQTANPDRKYAKQFPELHPRGVKCHETSYLDCAREAELESGREAAVHARGTWHCRDAKARDRNPENPQLRFIWVPSAAFHTATGAAPAVVATARVSKALGAV